MGVNDHDAHARAPDHLERLVHRERPGPDRQDPERGLRHRAGVHDHRPRLHQRPAAGRRAAHRAAPLARRGGEHHPGRRPGPAMAVERILPGAGGQARRDGDERPGAGRLDRRPRHPDEAGRDARRRSTRSSGARPRAATRRSSSTPTEPIVSSDVIGNSALGDLRLPLDAGRRREPAQDAHLVRQRLGLREPRRRADRRMLARSGRARCGGASPAALVGATGRQGGSMPIGDQRIRPDRADRLPRSWPSAQDIEVVAINDIADNETLAYLLKYDTVMGTLPGRGAGRGGQAPCRPAQDVRMLEIPEPDAAPLEGARGRRRGRGDRAASASASRSSSSSTPGAQAGHPDRAGEGRDRRHRRARRQRPHAQARAPDRLQRLLHDELPGADRQGAARDASASSRAS